MAAQNDSRSEPASAPETVNPEQEDEDSQAQSIADEARGRGVSDAGLGDSEKVSTGDDSDDVPDLIDRMRQMDSSGNIDFDAYRGERNDDDEEGLLGPDGED